MILKYFRNFFSLNLNRLIYPFSAKFFQFLSSLAIVKLMAYLFSPEQLALWSTALSGIAFYGLIFIGPIGIYLNRNIVNWHREYEMKKIMIFHFFYIFSIGLISLPSFYIFSKSLDVSEPLLTEFLVLIIPLIFIFQVLFVSYQSYLNVFGENKGFFLATLLMSFMVLVLPLVFIFGFGQNLFQWGVGYFSANLIGAVVSLFYLYRVFKSSRKKKTFFFSSKLIKNAAIFIIPALIFAIFSWVNIHFYKYGFILLGFKLEEISFLIIGLTLSHSLFSAVEQVLTSIYSSVYQRRVSSNQEEADEYWSDTIVGFVPILMIFAWFYFSIAEYLPSILLNDSYSSIYNYLLIGGIIEISRILLNLTYLRTQGINKTYLMLKPYISSFIICLGIFSFFYYQDFLNLIFLSFLMAIMSFISFLILIFSIPKKIILKILKTLTSFFFISAILLAACFYIKEILISIDTPKIFISFFLFIFWAIFGLYTFLNDKKISTLDFSIDKEVIKK